jgi:hypothetical protein
MRSMVDVGVIFYPSRYLAELGETLHFFGKILVDNGQEILDLQ